MRSHQDRLVLLVLEVLIQCNLQNQTLCMVEVVLGPTAMKQGV